MNQYLRPICQRLSLRKPQAESLEILSKIAAEVMPADARDADLATLLEQVKTHAQAPEHVTDFERSFPSCCFALATGVGKTRLMGANIAYLHAAYGTRHFMVLAPNLTIYNKLIADFTEGTPKYVFKGIAQFASAPPVIVTGDNYESGVGTHDDQLWDRVFINIFNISKFSTKDGRKFHKLAECIGESYFEYLSNLPDLVLLMDEAHRYRASAAMGMINELKPRLGIELTATPQIERGAKSETFKNIVYQYNLADAMRDGYVKEPEVATRQNFNKARYTDDELERIKLEDGIRIHNQKKVDLELYARNEGVDRVKPFMLVVARDTDHAAKLMTLLESPDFCKGDYKDKVIQVDSKSTSRSKEESEDIVEKLLTVEQEDNPVEIVIHVNMLKEGWDVTNLYTIVPLRAANSKTLVEQSIGRGLRLPYGRRTGIAEVDTLTIVSHDRFEEIVRAAQEDDFIINKRYLPEDGDEERREVVVAPSAIESALGIGQPAPDTAPSAPAEAPTPAPQPAPQAAPLFTKPEEQEAAKVVLATVKKASGKLDYLKDLQKSDIKERLAAEAKATFNAGRQMTLEGVAPEVDIDDITDKVIEEIQKRTIEIPRVMVIPEGQVTGYHDFDLVPPSTRPQPVDDERMLIQSLENAESRRILESDLRALSEPRPEDYLLNKLIDYDDVDYDNHGALINKLAGQMVDHLRSYLPDDEAIEKVLRQNASKLASLIHAQMEEKYFEHAANYTAKVYPNPTILESTSHDAPEGQQPHHFRNHTFEKTKIRSMIFGGFSKCLYPIQKYSSDTERVLSIILEDDPAVLKWVKPTNKHIEIDYRHAGMNRNYWPDFIIEAEDAYYLVEPKGATEVDDDVVQEKARAAVKWCQHATDHNAKDGLNPWRYLLVPHDEITISANLAGLAAIHQMEA
jgi:type III restriction enzyme